MVKKSILGAVTCALALVTIIGCERSSPTQRPADDSLGANNGGMGKIADPIPAEITLYGTEDPEVVDERYKIPIEKKFPHYTVKYVKKPYTPTLAELVVSGTNIDLYIGGAGTYARDLLGAKLEYDMTELIKKHQVDLNRFEPEGLNQIRKIGGLYALPIYADSLVLYYNKDIFDKFGVSYPKDGMTWDDVAELSKKLSRVDKDKPYYGIWVYTKPYMRRNQLSLPFVDPKTNKAIITNDGWKNILDTVFKATAEASGIKSKLGPEMKYPSSSAFYNDQDIAMVVSASTMFLTAPKDKLNFGWDMVALPTFKERPRVGAQANYMYLALLSSSKNKDQAMEVLNYLTSDDYQAEISKQGFITSLKNRKIIDMFGQGTLYTGKNLQAVFYNQFAPTINLTPNDEYVVENGLDQVALKQLLSGTLDTNSALRAAEETANQAIELQK